MNMSKKIAAEFLGTFWLVLGGCGAAVLAAGVPDVGIGYAGVALAFGLTVLTGVYAFGHISGGHFNPAVTFGLFAAGRFPAKDIPAYWIAQVAGGLAAGSVLYVIASGSAAFDPTAGFAANGYGEHSPQHYEILACAVCEIVMTFMFLMVILNTTLANPGYAGIAIGLCLTLIHLISIPVTNTSVNPARSMGVAFFQGSWAVEQLWFFWVMPLAGAGLAGIVQRWLVAGPERQTSQRLAS
ncbi:MAG TPA: aquaporin Z [Rhizomicrobium sp.]